MGSFTPWGWCHQAGSILECILRGPAFTCCLRSSSAGWPSPTPSPGVRPSSLLRCPRTDVLGSLLASGSWCFHRHPSLGPCCSRPPERCWCFRASWHQVVSFSINPCAFTSRLAARSCPGLCSPSPLGDNRATSSHGASWVAGTPSTHLGQGQLPSQRYLLPHTISLVSMVSLLGVTIVTRFLFSLGDTNSGSSCLVSATSLSSLGPCTGWLEGME